MNKRSSAFLKKHSAAALAAALILPQAGVPAWANVIAAAAAGKAAQGGVAAGAAVRPVPVQTGLGTMGIAPAPNLDAGLPGALTPSLRLEAAAGAGLQFVTASPGVASPEARVPRAPSAAALPRAASPAFAVNAARIPEAPAAAPNAVRRVLSSIGKALKLGRTQALFEGGRVRGMGFLPEESEPSDSLDLDERPTLPENTETPGVSWNRVHFPGRPSQPTSNEDFKGSSVRPIALPGNPRTAAEVERALRELVERNTGELAGVTSEMLETVVAHKVAGKEGLSDAIYVNFKQLRDAVAVEGTYLNFTVKIVRGEAVLVASSAHLFPSLAVDAYGKLSEEQIMEKAFDRLGRPTGSYEDMTRVGRRVMHLGGRWRAVYLMLSESKTLVAAVDVNSGETFAWDPRHKASGAEVSGRAEGRGVEFDPGATGENLDVMPMAHMEVVSSDGRTFHTDADGYFTYEGAAAAEVTLTAKLKGKYARITDQQKADLTATALVKPGERLRLLFNPEGAEENSVAQVNAYRHVTKVHDWLVAHGVDVSQLHRDIPVKTNINQDCNAYYTPWSPSLNFFQGSKRCANTSFDSVVYHEYGHFVDDMIGGIVNGALSEGWGDILSMYITGTPEIGRGFLKGKEESWIRDGRNKYRYRGRDEVHDQGQAWMGFGWKLRQALIASFEAAGLTGRDAAVRGTELAAQLVIPVFFANARDIPQAIEAVLLRDVGEDGRAAHFKEISAAAAAHGIKLAQPRPGELTASPSPHGGVLRWLAKAARRLAGLDGA